MKPKHAIGCRSGRANEGLGKGASLLKAFIELKAINPKGLAGGTGMHYNNVQEWGKRMAYATFGKKREVMTLGRKSNYLLLGKGECRYEGKEGTYKKRRKETRRAS